MDALTLLTTLCPVCDGPIQFEAYRMGEHVGCPHCQTTIALGAVEPLTPPRHKGIYPPEDAEPMPPRRLAVRLAVGVAVLFLALGAGWWSWRELAAPSGRWQLARTEVAPPSQSSAAIPPLAPPPTVGPTASPPIPDSGAVSAELLRQQQELLIQEQLLAELRRANDLAESNARWERSRTVTLQPVLVSQPVEIVEPVQMIQPIQSIQVIQSLPSPIRQYGGGLRIGNPSFYSPHGDSGSRVRQGNAGSGNVLFLPPGSGN